MASIEHPYLGRVTGVASSDKIVQFLGIKYATLKNRLAQPELIPSANGLDATKYGPGTAAPPACEAEFGFIQQSVPITRELNYTDRDDGLNLNITLPKNQLDAGSKPLPVFVYIHGGGLNIGSGTWPQYDMTKFVELAVRNGQPCIAVTLNYRLGFCGFLTSTELRDAGYLGNNGFRDQRAALLWIRKHISGFGGDPDNVALSGQSAGGASSSYQLQSTEPLFKRLILFSGSCLLMQPLPSQAHDFFYSQAMEALGLADLSKEERIDKLLTLPYMEIIGKLPPGQPAMPLLDGDIVKWAPTFKGMNDFSQVSENDLPGKNWCEAILLGDCQFDSHIMATMAQNKKPNIALSLPASAQNTLAPHTSAADKLLSDYGLIPHHSSTSDEEAFLAFLMLFNDIGFHAPTLTIASGFSATKSAGKTTSHVYFFNERNPWDGPYKGQATHILDVAYLFQNFNHSLDERQEQVAEAFARDVLDFVTGAQLGWSEWDADRPVERVYGPSETEILSIVQGLETEKTKRRRIVFGFEDVGGLDAVYRVFNNFMAGR